MYRSKNRSDITEHAIRGDFSSGPLPINNFQSKGAYFKLGTRKRFKHFNNVTLEKEYLVLSFICVQCTNLNQPVHTWSFKHLKTWNRQWPSLPFFVSSSGESRSTVQMLPWLLFFSYFCLKKKKKSIKIYKIESQSLGGLCGVCKEHVLQFRHKGTCASCEGRIRDMKATNCST